MMFLTLLLATLASVFVGFYDKKGLSSGLKKIQYIFLKMIGLLPFVFVLFFIYDFKFEINISSILLIVALLLINLTNYLGLINVVKKTSPYETGVLLTLSIPIVYFIDVLFKIKTFDYIAVIPLVIIVIGVVILSFKEIKFKGLVPSLAVSLISSISKGYVLHYLLKHISIPNYLLIVHLVTALVIFAFFQKSLEIKTITRANYKWAFTTQFVGTFLLVLNAILAKNSVGLYVMLAPSKLLLILIVSYFIKKKDEFGNSPTTIKLIGAITTIVGMVAFAILSM